MEKLLKALYEADMSDDIELRIEYAKKVADKVLKADDQQRAFSNILDTSFLIHGQRIKITEDGISRIMDQMPQDALRKIYEEFSYRLDDDRLNIPIKFIALGKIEDQDFLIKELQELDKNIKIGIIDAEPEYTNRGFTLSYLIAKVKSDRIKMRLFNNINPRTELCSHVILSSMKDDIKNYIFRSILLGLDKAKKHYWLKGLLAPRTSTEAVKMDVNEEPFDKDDFDLILKRFTKGFIYLTKSKIKYVLKNFDDKKIVENIIQDFKLNEFDYVSELVEDDKFLNDLLSGDVNYTDGQRYYLIQKIKNPELKENLLRNNILYNKVNSVELKESDELIGIDPSLGIGIELEGIGMEPVCARKIVEDLKFDFSDWKVVSDASIPNGAEIVSPILRDNKKDIGKLEYILNIMKEMDMRTDKNCGGHIHLDSEYLRVNGDKEAGLKNLSTIWEEAEGLIYKISNGEGITTRPSAKKYAKKSKYMIEKAKNTHQSYYRKKKTYEETLVESQEGQRYFGLNFSNLDKGENQSIEIRISNGTIDGNELKENILLYGKFMEVARGMVVESQKYEEKLKQFYRKDLSERDKLEALLNLLFDNEEQKDIYRRRWESIKTDRIYNSFSDNDNSYRRGDYTLEGQTKKMLGMTLPHDVYAFGKRIKEKFKANNKDDYTK